MFSWTTRGGRSVAPIDAAKVPVSSAPATPLVRPTTGSLDEVRTDHVTAPVTLTIGGDATNTLRPGVSSPIDVSFTNSRLQPVVISSLNVSVASVDAPRATAALPCGTGDYSITQAPSTLALTVQGSSSTSLSLLGIPISSWPQVGMINSSNDQNGCLEAKVQLKYLAVGVSR